MERYSEYKDSGVQWLGEIPGHWKTVRVKTLLSERVDKSDTGLEEPLSMSQKYGIIFLYEFYFHFIILLINKIYFFPYLSRSVFD